MSSKYQQKTSKIEILVKAVKISLNYDILRIYGIH